MDFPDTSFDTVCIDFDDTIAESRWPSNEIGPPIAAGVEAIIHYHGLGKEIIVHTARPKSHEGLLWRWFTDQGLNSVIHDIVCGKPRAGLYIDDRAWNPFTVEIARPVDDEVTVLDAPEAETFPVAIAREPSRQVQEEEERRRQALRRQRGEDETKIEAMD